jgi:hypothetical protein
VQKKAKGKVALVKTAKTMTSAILSVLVASSLVTRCRGYRCNGFLHSESFGTGSALEYSDIVSYDFSDSALNPEWEGVVQCILRCSSGSAQIYFDAGSK